MDRFEVRDRRDRLCVYMTTWSRERAQDWIDTFPLRFLVDKTTTREDFVIVDRKEP